MNFIKMIFFIFGDLNFRTKKFGLVDLQNHVKIVLSETKIVSKNGKKKKNFRFSLDFTKKKDKNKKNKEKNEVNTSSEKSPDEKKRKEKEEKEIKDDYCNYYTNKIGNVKKV